MEICGQTFPFDLALCPTRLNTVPVPSVEVRGTLPRGPWWLNWWLSTLVGKGVNPHAALQQVPLQLFQDFRKN